MEAMKAFEAACRAMAEPVFYPHPVSRVERRDTHISAVFLTGAWVYKLKKPVDFGFLDFRTLEDRRRFCTQEVLLNQRLSHGVYAGVVGICRDEAGRFFLDGSDQEDVVEVAVKMRQLPDDARLDALLEHRNVSREDMERLGRHLAEFYMRCVRSPEIDHFGELDVISFNMEENFRQVEPFVSSMVHRERWEFIRQVSRAFFQHWHELFENRVRDGRIRDGHGDLRAEHIYFHDDIQIIDCIEFNDRFRYGDVVADLAFLHMDLERLGHSALSQSVCSSYVDHAGDPQLYALLDFYAAYRAIVKLKVACLRSTEVHGAQELSALHRDVAAYLKQAYRYAVQFSRPTLWVFCGLPATGKSALAAQIAEALSLSLFQSDRIRKEFEALPATHEGVAPVDQGMYRPERRHRVYAEMLALAQEQLKNGHSAILDATFASRHWRDEARQLAADLNTNVLFVECVSTEAMIRRRLEQREKTVSLSDARLQHLPELMKRFDPLTEVAPHEHVRLDTDQPLTRAFLDLLSEGYAKRCAQVEEVL